MHFLSFYKHIIMFSIAIMWLAQGYAQTSPCPPNIDFETGSLNNWQFFIGTCCPINTAQSTQPQANIHELMSGTGLDYYGKFPVVAPGGGKYSLKLGNKDPFGQAERARYNMLVPAGTGKYLFVFRYAVVLEDPSHPAVEQPRFEVTAYDAASQVPISCGSFNFIASSNLPGFVQSTVNADVWYKPWSAAIIDLTAFRGKFVTLDFATGDCGQGKHFGYAYVDVDCQPFQTTNISCTGAPSVTLKAPPGFQSYEWRNAGLTSVLGNTESITFPTPAVNTTYAVIISPYAGYGCADTVFMNVTINDMVLTLPNDTTLCNGADRPLNVVTNSSAKPFTYTWVPSTGLSCTNCQSPIANWQTSMSYNVTVVDANGCTQTSSVKVDRVKEVYADLLLPDDTVCQYAHATLTNIAGNVGGVSNFWNLDTNGRIYGQDGVSPATAWWSTPGKKRIILKTSSGFCNIWDTAYLYVRPGPFAHFDMKANVCLGETLEIRPAKHDAWYFWNIEGHPIKDTNYQSPLKISYNTLGKKPVSLTVKGFNGCLPPPYDTFVTVREFPVADAFVAEDEICYGDTVTMKTFDGKNYIYAWTPVFNFVSNSASEVRAEIPQPIMLHLEVANEWGCRTYDSTYVMPAHCCNVYLPTAFTPNGDGLNDRFKIISVGHHKIHAFIVTSRWGKIIYSSTNQYEGWDGTYKGEKQDNGTYFYYLKYDCTDNQTLEEKGSFTLIR